ncbi:M24 family metallopeptidase [Haladaptatus cibarius]|uniref:M24 family metallopeptidase n=1 Tax=Haladaptatus cibarius TaxID=453847 RepID=UPI0009FF8E87|nr:Xaa-Pro peptidase family protein [Haladaptatus cibarius]
MPRDGQPIPNYQYISSELEKQNADAYVHIGDESDQMLWYLTRFYGPDRDYAFVYTDEKATLCAPALFYEQAKREFPGTEVTKTQNSNRSSAAMRAIDVLQDSSSVSRILVPASIPHCAHFELEQAGYEVVTTDVIGIARMYKSSHEIECIRETMAIAQEAMRHAESILAASTTAGNELVWNSAPLTTERLRREINAVVAKAGGNDFGNTVVGAGVSCADLHYNGNDDIVPGETVLIDLGPRGPSGYFGDITRTFVPGTVHSWEENVYEVVSEALEAGLQQLNDAPGIYGEDVHETIVSVIETNGFETGDVDVGLYHGTGHGVGTSLHEPPFFSERTELKPGQVITVEPGIYDPDRGGIRLEDLVLITDDGIENFVTLPYSIDPR